MLTSEAPESLEREYLRARAALDRGETGRARRDFEALLVDLPRFAPVWDGLGGCYEQEGDLRQAGACYRRAMRLDPRSWRSAFNWGAALYRAGDPAAARRWLRAAARRAPRQRCILHCLGHCSLDLGRPEEALAWFRRALEQPEGDVSDAELHLSVGLAEAGRGSLDAAEEALSRSCLLRPDDARTWHHWAIVAARAGRHEEAERMALRAQALDGRSPRHSDLLVELAIEAERWERAEEFIRPLEEREGSGSLAAALRAELLLRQGDRDGACRWALEALVRAEGEVVADRALRTLRGVRGEPVRCRGFRLLVEGQEERRSYFRPYVVLAPSEGEARAYVAEIQEALDRRSWSVIETLHFAHPGTACPGVYHVPLRAVWFDRF